MYESHFNKTFIQTFIHLLPGLSGKSSAVIGQFVITTAVRGVPKPQQTAVPLVAS